MDAFESLVALLLQWEGYWTTTSFKVELTGAEKRAIGRPTTPRWEIDVVAYRGSTNEILAVECKSFLHSTGVIFRGGCFEPQQRYKLFSDRRTRDVVLDRLARQLVASKACRRSPSVKLCLAAGKIARKSDRKALAKHFAKRGWGLLDEEWIQARLKSVSGMGYQNDVAHIVAKLLLP